MSFSLERMSFSLEQLRTIFLDPQISFPRRIEAAEATLLYELPQGAGNDTAIQSEAYRFLQIVGADDEVPATHRIEALKIAAKYENVRIEASKNMPDYKARKRQQLALKNSKLRVRLFQEGTWPAPPGWMLTLADIEDEPLPDLIPDDQIAAAYERAAAAVKP
jgi:hypothetical protein